MSNQSMPSEPAASPSTCENPAEPPLRSRVVAVTFVYIYIGDEMVGHYRHQFEEQTVIPGDVCHFNYELRLV